MALAGFSAAKIAREGKKLGRGGHVGICLAFTATSSIQVNQSPAMRRLVAGAAMAVTAVMAAGCGISQQQEVELGAQQAQQVNQQLPIIQDVAVNRYLNILGDSLAKLTQRSD